MLPFDGLVVGSCCFDEYDEEFFHDYCKESQRGGTCRWVGPPVISCPRCGKMPDNTKVKYEGETGRVSVNSVLMLQFVWGMTKMGLSSRLEPRVWCFECFYKTCPPTDRLKLQWIARFLKDKDEDFMSEMVR